MRRPRQHSREEGGPAAAAAAAAGPTGRRYPGGAAGERPRRFGTGAVGRGLPRRRLPGCPTRLCGAGGGAAPSPATPSQRPAPARQHHPPATCPRRGAESSPATSPGVAAAAAYRAVHLAPGTESRVRPPRGRHHPVLRPSGARRAEELALWGCLRSRAVPRGGCRKKHSVCVLKKINKYITASLLSKIWELRLIKQASQQ